MGGHDIAVGVAAGAGPAYTTAHSISAHARYGLCELSDYMHACVIACMPVDSSEIFNKISLTKFEC